MFKLSLGAFLFSLTTTLAAPPKIVTKPIQKPSVQLLCMAWVLHSEAGGEGLMGLRAVADVIQTRQWRRNLTTCQVVAQMGQFSGYKTNIILKVSQKSLHTTEKVLKMKPVVKGAEYFHNDSVKPKWANKMKVVGKIGKHTFLKTSLEE